MGDAFAPWHIIILLIVLVLLFGSRRLPGAAKSLGESMHIFKKSVSGLNPDDTDSAAGSASPPVAWTTAPAASQLPPIAAPVADPTAQQLAELQRQVAELQRQNAVTNGGQPSGAQQSTQPL